MHVKKDKADRLLELTSKKYLNRNIHRFVDQGYLDGYQELLKDIAKKSQYHEGEQITDRDLSRIKNVVVSTLDGMRKMMVEQPLTLEEIKAKVGERELNRILALKESKMHQAIRKIEEKGRLSRKDQIQYDTLGALITVNDYLYAMAMKTLGCPDIPESFGSDMQNVIKKIANRAEFEMKENDFKNTSVDKRYEAQRGKNAKNIIKANVEVKKLIADKKALPFSVAQYAGDYFALKKRQEGHGKWWVFFHKKENEARTTLLANMKKTLQGVLDEGDDIDKLDPVTIAEIYSQTNIARRANEAFQNGIAKRNGMPSNIIEHEPTPIKRTDKEKDKATAAEQIEEEREKQNKKDMELEEELRTPIKFGDDAFAESQPVRMTYVNKVDDKIVAREVVHDDGDKEVDLSNFVPKI